MENKRWGKVLFGFSIVLIVLSVVFFAYTKFNLKYSKKLTAENNALRSEIESVDNNIDKLQSKLSDAEIVLNKKSLDFYESYGYQFDGNKKEELDAIIKSLEKRNTELLNKMTTLLKNNSNYYVSNIYENEIYDKSVDTFLNLSSDNNLEKYKNIYEELKLDDVIKNSDGFISTIRNQNDESEELNSLLFYLSIYGLKIEDFSRGYYKSLADVYSDINSYSEILSEIERLGYSTGDLNSKKFISIRDDFNEYLVPFYKNRGLIISLEKGDKSEAKK